MIINVKKSRIARMLFVISILFIYGWLILWTTRRISNYAEKRNLKYYNQPSQNVNIESDVNKQKNNQLKSLTISRKENSNKNTCKKELLVSEQRWLTARLDEKIEPSWTSKNLQVDSAVYQWWLTLQHSKGMHTMKILKQLLEVGVTSINPSHDDEDSSTKCRTCAVIGNSGNLRNSEYGNKIDSHDYVIRINKAPTTGFEADVGRKTTHRFMYPESALPTLSEETHFVLVPFKPLDLKWLLSALTNGEIKKTYTLVPSKINCNKSKILIIAPKFIWYVYNRWMQQRGHYPSTGFLAVIYALHKCSKINLYGFGADENGNWHHYWENLPKSIAGAFKATGVHDPEWEKTMLNNLDKFNILHINVPAPVPN